MTVEAPVLAQTLGIVSEADEITVSEAMAAVRVAYMQGYEDATAEREDAA